mmetsp:Transcript_16252/g.52946  ORF Transcript_16252/g.52946 Transcript_16252/m.52946 type:complete len:378 (+) Transcript_16252:194-1327(+)
MADYDDPDPALFRSGNVVYAQRRLAPPARGGRRGRVGGRGRAGGAEQARGSGDARRWAKVYDRPWWPCVMFNSWAAVRRWNLPVPMEGVAELGEDQAIGIFLDDYEFTVFDKHSNSIQDWDYITPEAILEELGGDPSRKNLKKAIRDGKRLVRISRGGARAAPDDEDRYAEPAPQRGGYRGKKKRGGYRGPREPKAKPRQNDFFSPLFGATVPAGAAPPPVLPATAGPLAPAKRATRAKSPRAADVDDDRDGSSLSSGSKQGEVTPATSEPGDDDDGGAAPRTSRAGRVTRKPRKLRDDDDAAALDGTPAAPFGGLLSLVRIVAKDARPSGLVLAKSLKDVAVAIGTFLGLLATVAAAGRRRRRAYAPIPAGDDGDA